MTGQTNIGLWLTGLLIGLRDTTMWLRLWQSVHGGISLVSVRFKI